MTPRNTLLLAILLASLSGCASMSALGTARTLDAGNFQYGGELITGAAVLEREDAETTALQMGASFSYGVTDHVEIGSRVWGIPALTEWTWGGELQAKFQVVRPENPSGTFQLSLAPRVAFHQLGKAESTWEHMSGTLAVMMGFSPNDELQFIITPQFGGDLLMNAGSNDVIAFHAGGSIGVAWSVQACTTVLPNITFMYTDAALTDGEPIWLYQISISLLLDG